MPPIRKGDMHPLKKLLLEQLLDIVKEAYPTVAWHIEGNNDAPFYDGERWWCIRGTVPLSKPTGYGDHFSVWVYQPLDTDKLAAEVSPEMGASFWNATATIFHDENDLPVFRSLLASAMAFLTSRFPLPE